MNILKKITAPWIQWAFKIKNDKFDLYINKKEKIVILKYWEKTQFIDIKKKIWENFKYENWKDTSKDVNDFLIYATTKITWDISEVWFEKFCKIIIEDYNLKIK